MSTLRIKKLSKIFLMGIISDPIQYQNQQGLSRTKKPQIGPSLLKVLFWRKSFKEIFNGPNTQLIILTSPHILL